MKVKEENARFDCEHTDTFGGEANYCWVNRSVVEAPNARMALRRFKQEIGMTGIRGETSDYGDMLEWRPRGICQVVFVSWHDDNL